MNPKEFKKKWAPNKLARWTEFDKEELAKSPLKEETKLFLQNGFPEDGAPYLNFGWRSTNEKFFNVYDFFPNYYIELEAETKNYWIFGSDGSGNLICFDTSNDDRLVLLDHETGFELIDRINSSIKELAYCLLYYKEFIKQIRTEFGNSAWSESKYEISHLYDLKEKFLSINPNIFNQSSLWDSAVNGLIEELTKRKKREQQKINNGK